MDGTLKIGDFVGFLLFLSLFYELIDQLNSLNQMILSGRAAADRCLPFWMRKGTQRRRRQGTARQNLRRGALRPSDLQAPQVPEIARSA